MNYDELIERMDKVREQLRRGIITPHEYVQKTTELILEEMDRHES